jgi:type I restriction enzyme, S subunit
MMELPPGWTRVQLADVASTQLGRMLSSRRETGAHAKPYLRNRDVQWGEINVEDLPVMDFAPEDEARFRLVEGDVLVCEGGEVGRAAVWKGQLEECYYQKALHRVRTSDELVPTYLRYLLEHYAGVRAFEQFTSGSTIAHLPQEDLRRLPVDLPPNAEQIRIVEAIEERLSHVDAGVRAIQRITRGLQRLRASVDNAALSGTLVPADPDHVGATRLAEQLRDEARGGRRKRTAPATDAPDGETAPPRWRLMSLGDLAESIEYGTSQKTRSDVDGVPVLRMGNLGRGTIDYRDLKYLPVADVDERLLLRPGDLLFNRTNSAELVGKSAVFTGYSRMTTFASYLIRVRPLPSANLEWASLVLNSPLGRRYIASVRTQQVGQANVNGTKLAAVPIPLPSAEEQARILAEHGRLSSIIASLEAAAVKAVRQSEVLRASTLAVAFSGRLVQQSDRDEPVMSLERTAAAPGASGERARASRQSRPTRVTA